MTLFPYFSFSQSIIVLEKKDFQSVIFPKAYTNSAYRWALESNRFSPTIVEVEKFENNLRSKLKKINNNLWNQRKSCPIIHKNLKKYNRQYVGFIDESGKKYLVINFLWKKSFEVYKDEKYYNELGDWKKHWQVWFDGCSHYWNVKYYCESDTLFELRINGSE